MPKNLIVILLCCLTTAFVSAEELPAGYYDAIQGQSDSTLKSTLHLLIRGGERYAYGAATYHSTNNIATADVVGDDGEILYHKGDTIWRVGDFKAPGTWSAFLLCDQLSDGTIWDMYSTTKRYFPIAGGSAAGMDIEHCLPKSWWGWNSSSSAKTDSIGYRAYCDLYHLNPADREANNNKSNYPPGILQDSNKVNNTSFFMGKDTTWGDYAFDICDEYKGDFARAYFYIATAYQDLTWATAYNKYVSNDSYLTFSPYLTQILLQWNRIDPVSEKEINRLDAISSIQHNRNPFIEYPDLVEYIWGNKKGKPVDLHALTCTTSDDYTLPYDTVNPLAYPATDISSTGFTAHWKEHDCKSYLLEVFTRTESGANDTIISMLGINSNLVRNSGGHVQWLTEDGSAEAKYTLMDGTYAICMSTTSAKRQLRLTNFGTAPDNTFLTVKCAIYKGDTSAVLCVRGDNDELLYKQPLVLDDAYYTFSIPKGTQQISLIQEEIGKSKNYHRISLQQVFLYSGDYQVIETPLAGFPKMVNSTELHIKHNIPAGQKVYYRVTPAGLRTSNTITLTIPSDTHTIVSSTPCKSINTPIKIIHNGHIYIIQQEHIYGMLGQKR